MTLRCIAITWLTAVIVERTALDLSAADTFKAVNTSDYLAQLFIWPKSLGQYLSPEVVIAPHSEAKVPYRKDEQYWLVGRDDAGRDFPIGWVDIGAEIQRGRGSITVKPVFETKTRDVGTWDCKTGKWVMSQQSYSVHKLIWEGMSH